MYLMGYKATPRRAFLEQLEQNRHDLYRFVVHTVWDTSVAPHVFANVIAKAWDTWAGPSGDEPFLMRVLRVLARECLAANGETLRPALPVAAADHSLLDALTHNPPYTEMLSGLDDVLASCGDILFRALRNLSTTDRMCLVLRDAHSFSYDAIGSILGMPPASVEACLERGRSVLRKALLHAAIDAGLVQPEPTIIQHPHARLAQGGNLQ